MRCIVERAGSAARGWELAHAPLPAHFAPYVESWVGYREWSAARVERLEAPRGRAVLIFELAPAVALGRPHQPLRRYGAGFFAALDDAPTLTAFTGEQAGVQVNLTPRGAHALLGRDTADLTGRVVDAAAARFEPGLCAALAAAEGWPERLLLVQHALSRRLAAGAEQSNLVRWAVGRIDERRGAVRIDALAEELGFSRKYLHRRFVDEVGLSPKRYAALRRFDHVLGRLAAPRAPTLAALAAETGYADQAHLAREVRRFSGLTAARLAPVLGDPLGLAIAALTASPA